MKQDCITDTRRLRSCTRVNTKSSSSLCGSAWVWDRIDVIYHSVDRALLVLFALSTEAGIVKFFHH